MKILIAGAGFENKGAEAMMLTVQKELGKRLPDAAFYTAVEARERHVAYTTGFTPVKDKWMSGSLLKRIMKIPRKVPKRFHLTYHRVIRSLLPKLASSKMRKLDIDVLIDISGYLYFEGMDPWYINRIAGIVSSEKVMKNNYFFPQAWGPYTTSVTRFWLKQLHAQATSLYSRDAVSSNYLIEENIQEGAFQKALDIAFLFEGEDLAVGKSILSNHGLADNNRPLIGFVPNMRVYERTKGDDIQNEYLKFLEGLIDFCINELDVNIAILPNECNLSSEKMPDDRYLCSVLANRFSATGRLISLTDNYSAKQLKAVIGNLDFLVASRFHSLIFALTQSVPVLALGWSHKYLELLKSFSLQEYILSHDSLQSNDSYALLKKAWDQREASSEKISKALPAIRGSVTEFFDNVAQKISS